MAGAWVGGGGEGGALVHGDGSLDEHVLELSGYRGGRAPMPLYPPAMDVDCRRRRPGKRAKRSRAVGETARKGELTSPAASYG